MSTFRNRKNLEKSTNIKSNILMQQNDELLIKLRLTEECYEIKSIIFFNPYTREERRFPTNKANHEYILKVKNEYLLNQLSDDVNASTSELQSIVKPINTANKKDGLWNWYAEVYINSNSAPKDVLDLIIEQLEKSEGKSTTNPWIKEIDGSYKKYLRIGKFPNTNIEGLQKEEFSGSEILTYINKYGYLVTAIDEEVVGRNKLQVESLTTKNNKVNIVGRLATGYFGISQCQAILKSRNTTSEYAFDIDLKRDEAVFSEKFGRNIYEYRINLNLDDVFDYNEDTYDLFIEAKMPYSLTPIRLRVGRPTLRAKLFFGEFSGRSQDGMLLINPYYTIYQNNLSFEVYPFDKENYKYLKRARRFSKAMQLIHRKKDVWLVGERSYKAQDTGYHFFKYMRENHPEKNVYYVISKDSPEYENVAPYGNVLDYGSKEHIRNTIIATKILTSHHTNYLFPIRTKSFDRIVKATRVFLQHGVIGVKNMGNIYGFNSQTFDVDLFITSSDYEKEYIMRDMGYKSKDVVVTGLSRFDELFKPNVTVKRQILIIPTWRDWLQNIDQFLESEYYERYLSLINNEKLIAHSQENNYELVFCLHPNMQKFSSYFEGSSVRLIYQGDEDVQKLIKESALLLTDYSSVAFDFSFLHKPVIYYQFDQSRFIGRRESHIDLENELPGLIIEDEDNLVDKVISYVHNDFEMESIYIERANKFIKYRDQNSSKRIYEAAKGYVKGKESLIGKLRKNEVVKSVFRKFRSSKYYFPTMKIAYSVMKTILPIDKKKVFFESGLGKNFSDSPKEIFETLQEENREFKYIWSYNRTLNKNYRNTKVVQRLSPSYYYHLATSKYWVNNQNFPTYINKRKGTSYIQTWHGTPLKKMLYDIEVIHGRDETYLSRISSAVKHWDYLVSPSKYATECFRSAFNYSGEVLEEGYPRNDIFYKEHQEADIISLKNKLNIDSNKKVIIYAATFRDNQKSGNKFTFDLPIDFKNFYEKFGDEYVLLIRMHVVVSDKINIPEEYSGSIINVSSYPDIQRLLILSDVLITDYSSVFFDFLNTDKPILFYTHDLAEYRDNLRGFYLDFENEAPGPICINEQELFDSLQNIEQVKKEYHQKYTKAKKRFCYLDDGKATSRIVEKVFKSN